MADGSVDGALSPERSVLREGTDLLFKNATSSLIATFLCAVTYGVVVWGEVPERYLYPWGGLIGVVTIGRWLHARGYTRCDATGEDCHRWRRQFLYGMIASGALWGYAGIFLFVPDLVTHQALFFVTVSGLAVGGVFSYPSYRVVAPTFAALAILPLALRYALLGDAGGAVGFLLVVFVAALTTASFRFSAMVASSLAMRTENAQRILDAKNAQIRFETLARATHEGVFLHRDGIILDVNERIVEMVGIPEEALVGKHIFDFVPPEYREEVEERIAKGTGGRYVINLLLPDGRRLPVEVEGRSVPYDGGAARVVAIVDVTCRQEGERALRESQALLVEAMDLAGMAIWTYDETTDLMTLGERFHAARGEPTIDPTAGVMTPGAFEERFVHPDDAGSLRPLLQRALAEGAFSGELRVRRADGGIGYIALRLRVEERPGGGRRVNGITYDVTERMRAFNELTEAKQKADKANQLKGRFVSLVSHDLKSPLTGVLSVLKLLQDDQGLDSDGRKTLLVKSQASVEGLIAFINQLLDLSRISQGAMTPRKEFIDHLSFVRRQIENVVPMAEGKGVVIETNLAHPVRFFVDPALLGRAVGNLLSNAIKFTGEGDRIVISTEAGNRLVVGDSGVGIDPTFLPNLFSQEVRTSSFGTKGEKGSGMGLPFAYDVVVAHGGTLSVTSRPGEGSRFIIGLPEVKKVVLLVDDEPAHRQMMRRLAVEIDGVDTMEASDGREGLEALMRTTPDLIVTDIQMPGMDGFAFIEEVRRNQRFDHIPIIVATAAWTVSVKDQLDLRKKGMEVGASDFVIKPVTETNFLTALKNIWGRSEGDRRGVEPP